MSSKCGRMSAEVAGLCGMLVLLLLHGELIDVAVSGAEALRAASEVVHVPVVDLFGLKRYRLVPACLQRLGPGVERLRVMGLQRLNAGYVEARFHAPLF